MLLDDHLAPRQIYRNMTIDEAALAIINTPELDHWMIETDFHINRDAKVAALDVGRVSMRVALQTLAEAYNAELQVDEGERIIRFVSKSSIGFGFNLRPFWDWLTGKTPPVEPPTND